jgi:hypothetical protein
MATSLAFGEDPSDRKYSHKHMRSHIMQCFEEKQLKVSHNP